MTQIPCNLRINNIISEIVKMQLLLLLLLLDGITDYIASWWWSGGHQLILIRDSPRPKLLHIYPMNYCINSQVEHYYYSRAPEI